MRVWVDLTNTAHVVVLRPLIERLESMGVDVELTARPLSHTVDLLDDWGHPYTLLGAHGGASRAGKARAAADRLRRMVRFGRDRRFDCALGHGSVELPVACRVLGIANTTTFDYEWAALQHHVNCRMATRVLVPEAIPPDRLARYGARPPKLVRYPGLKEEYYLADFTPDEHLLDALGVEPGGILAVVRTAPTYADYLRAATDDMTPALLRRLAAHPETQTVVLPRTPEQGEAIRALGLERVIVPSRAVDARTLVALADLLVSAGGTMNREAAVLGTPVWTIFEGRLGAIDEQLIEQGRLRRLTHPDDVTIERKRNGGEERVRRDPAQLLALALPWCRGSLA